MNTGSDHNRPLPNGLRRRLVGGLGVITVGIATLGLGGLCRALANFATNDDCGNEFGRENCPDEYGQGGGRILYEIVYYDRRLKSCWPVGFYPELSGVVAAPLSTEHSVEERPR
ncbi:hypothetical protein RA307_15140 [Xanthobacteraceae bacterium Astr-EGSB]|uniref:hypothetical protein n=1 Tax=Astrobacterium formosum TaxID=3069710 RepID=UPI0027B306B6|nr:hypothetical protein [Xanthobacteraceae bacterium Astr-EGSB]